MSSFALIPPQERMVGSKDINMIREKFQVMPKVEDFHELDLMYVQILIALLTVACIIISFLSYFSEIL